MSAFSPGGLRSWSIAAVLAVVTGAVTIELTARFFLDDRMGMPTALAQFTATEGFRLSSADWGREWTRDDRLGWTMPVVTGETAVDPAASGLSVLLVGDSVTAGEDVERGTEDYPARLLERLQRSAIGSARIANIAVSGYGLDQMVLRVADEVDRRPVNVVVVAYIPHDLRRTALDIAFGWGKPRLVPTDAGTALEPPPSVEEFYSGYRSAKERGSLGFWYARYGWDQRIYFAPWFYAAHYERVFIELLARARAAAASRRLILLRLPDTSRDWARGRLTALAQSVFAGHHRDIDDCAFAAARRDGLDPNAAFEFHPTAKGHGIIAECLAPVLLEPT